MKKFIMKIILIFGIRIRIRFCNNIQYNLTESSYNYNINMNKPDIIFSAMAYVTAMLLRPQYVYAKRHKSK